ncbi:MAG: Serine/threonine-protein kinase PknD [Phycisphaerae bacterium]|nr:Serine/threonine-protein kinase PknD [Phycisphaerae bacterium]
MNEHAFEIANRLVVEGSADPSPEAVLAACCGDEQLAQEAREIMADIRAGCDAAERAFEHTPVSGEKASSKLGRFELLEPLGKGGFGVVWKAFDPQLNRPVALKIPRPDSLGSADAFLEEARKAARLDHPNLVPVYDFGSDGDYCFIVSRLIDGADLARRLSQGERFSPSDAATLVASVADGAAAAHAAGFVHRDIKPSNIIIDQGGRPYLSDLGTAAGRRELLDARAASSGTLAYMSPEQVTGDPEHIDPRSDIFSLGVVLYELLTGERPFVGDDRAALRRQIIEVDPWPPSSRNAHIPSDLSSTCLKALAKSPDDRFRNASEFAEALRAHASRSHGAGVIRRRSIIAVASVAVIGVCSWAVFLSPRSAQPDRPLVSAPAVPALRSESVTTTRPASQAARSIAILEFENHSTIPDQANWGKALRDMLMTDFSRAPGIVVVERARLSDLLAEHDLTGAAFMDPATAVQLGRGVAAHWVVTGALATDGDSVRIDARVVSVEEGVVAYADSVTGGPSFLSLQRSLVRKIVERLDLLDRDSAALLFPAAADSRKSAFALYAAASRARDEGRTAEAAAKLHEALQHDPTFDLAAANLAELERAVLEDLSGMETARLRDAGAIGAALQAHLAEQEVIIGQRQFDARYYAALVVTAAHAGLLGDHAREAALLMRFWREFSDRVAPEECMEQVKDIREHVRSAELFFQEQVDGGDYSIRIGRPSTSWLKLSLRGALSWPMYSQIWPFPEKQRTLFGQTGQFVDSALTEHIKRSFDESLPLTPVGFLHGVLHGSDSEPRYHFMDDHRSDARRHAEYVAILQLRCSVLRYLCQLRDPPKRIAENISEEAWALVRDLGSLPPDRLTPNALSDVWSTLRQLVSVVPGEDLHAESGTLLRDVVQQMRLNAGQSARPDGAVEFCSIRLGRERIIFLIQAPDLGSVMSPVPAFVEQRLVATLRSLPDSRQFNVVIFDGVGDTGRPSFRPECVIASPDHVREAISFVRAHKTSYFVDPRGRQNAELLPRLSELLRSSQATALSDVVVVYVGEPPNRAPPGASDLLGGGDSIRLHVVAPSLPQWLKELALRAGGQSVLLQAADDILNRDVRVIPSGAPSDTQTSEP